MGFKMAFAQNKLEGMQPVQDGQYKVLFIDFKPAHSKNANQVTGKHSINLNAKVKILEHPEFEQERFLIASLNEGVPSFIQDFVHSFGIEMDEQLEDNPSIPGTFDADKAKFKKDDQSTWVYAGPLTAKTAIWEVTTSDYNGRPVNQLRRFICSVPDCGTKYPKIWHSQDMNKKG